MSNNIHAYTEIVYKVYPAFISINKKDQIFIVSVRTKENLGYAEIEMTAEQLEQMAFDIMQKLNED